MTIKKFFQHTEAIFKKPAKQFTAEELLPGSDILQEIMQDMIDTHFQSDRVGVGLAANQVGHQYSLFLVYINEARAERENCSSIPLTFWANATFRPLTNEIVKKDEYCFSVLGMKGKDVPRYRSIEVTGTKICVELDEKKQIARLSVHEITVVLHDFQARLFQHELGHVNPEQAQFFYDLLENGVNDLDSQDVIDPRTSLSSSTLT